MFWTDDNSNRIYSANLDGTDTIPLITGVQCPGKYKLS